MTLVAAFNLGGAMMRKVSLVPPETTVSWTEKNEFRHLGTRFPLSPDLDWTSPSKLLTGRCNSSVVLKRS